MVMGKLKIFIVSVNVIICFSFGIGVYVFYKSGKPNIRGFYCNDESISREYHDSTVPVSILLPIIFVLLFTITIFVEILKKVNTQKSHLKNLFTGKGVRKLFKSMFIVIIMFLYGGGATMFITDVLKYSIGRLRPNYIALCKPDWDKMNCTESRHGVKPLIFGDRQCTETNIKEGRLSFPSGHAAFSTFSATYLILYIEHEVIITNAWLTVSKIGFQILLFVGALYTSATRVADNKHHPTDVVAGFILGLSVGYLIISQVFMKFFMKSKRNIIIGVGDETCVNERPNLDLSENNKEST